jgi:hypothetical protein
MSNVGVLRRTMFAALVGGCVAASFGSPALAQAGAAAFPLKLSGFTDQMLRAPNFAIPSYKITFFTSHQSTAQADVGIGSRLTATLTGLSDQSLRELTEAAYADLKAQFAAAGITLLPAEQVQSAVNAGGSKMAPGNAEVKDIRNGITIGKSVRKAYVAFGAAEAPIIEGLHSATATGAGGLLSRFGAQNQLGDVTKKLNAVMMMPSLVLDFADSDAKNGRDFLGRKRAMVSTDLGFTVSSTSRVDLSTAMNNARAVTPGQMFLTKDYRSDSPFASVGTKDSLSAIGQAYSSYLPEESEKGTLIAINLPQWEALVRDAYTAFNAALVAEIKNARK